MAKMPKSKGLIRSTTSAACLTVALMMLAPAKVAAQCPDTPQKSAQAAPDGTKQSPPAGSNEQIVKQMTDNPVVAGDGAKHAEGGPALPRERWMATCPQGEEADKSGKCRSADVVTQPDAKNAGKDTASTGATSNQMAAADPKSAAAGCN